MALILDQNHRFRLGWRILFQFVSFIILLMIVQNVQMAAEIDHSLWLFLISGIVYLAGMAVMVWAFARWIDHRNPGDFGFHFNKEWWLDFGAGFFLGAFTLSVVFFTEWKMGWLKIGSFNRSLFHEPIILIGFITFINLLAIAVGEEITFRCYEIKNLAEGLKDRLGGSKSIVIALVATSIFFGLTHMENPGATVMAGLNIVMAGLLLGFCYIVTGELGLSIGLHLAWGFFESFIFGYANSGQAPMSWLIGSRVSGPELWTGGLFGPEAGLLVTILLILDVLLVIVWIKFRKRWKKVRYELAEYQNPDIHAVAKT